MSNPENDSRLEQLSREAADRYTVKASPSWDEMEKALDKVLPTENKKRRPFLFWWIIPGVLLIGSVLWYIQYDPKTQQENRMITTAQNEPTKIAVTKEAMTSALKKEKTASKILKSNYTPKDKPPTKTQDEQLLKHPNKTNQLSTSTIVQENDILSQQKKIDQSLTISSAKQSNDIATINASSAENTKFITTTRDTGNNVTDKSIHTLKDSATISMTNKEEPAIEKTKDSIPAKNKKEKSNFSWALVAGIDATTVKFRYADKASLSGGIMLGYHLNRNSSIHIGGLYTRKNYKMAGSDFKAPAGSWVANYKLETVDGFCDMWEVPLLFRYTFDTKTKTKVFVSSGFSSYFMTRENYNYFYYYNGIPVRRNANYPDGKTHLFSILKLSAGWIRDTNKSAGLAVEPFANLPLSGLGFGGVKLSSFGVNFSYQFRQPNRKK